MIVIGLIFAFILKRLSTDEKVLEVELANDNEWIKANLPLRNKQADESKTNVSIPTME